MMKKVVLLSSGFALAFAFGGFRAYIESAVKLQNDGPVQISFEKPDIKDMTIGRLRQDFTYLLDTLTQGPQMLVGSSMGGWLMLLAALDHPARIKGLVGIAAAPDFTKEFIWERIEDKIQRTHPFTEILIEESQDQLTSNVELIFVKRTKSPQSTGSQDSNSSEDK